ncbi:MAG TPA: ABC transporter ATP-binding protein [Salinisphaeraceae bacterium]|nr:ABC transporter ATP-binding protein [Salinisphaeraceae bacterium]
MLEIDNLTVRYGRTVAVESFALELGADEIVTLVGPTGCGKTSVLRAVAGLVRPAAGAIRLGALHITPHHDVPPEKRNVGLVFQDFALFPHYNVAQNVGFRCRNAALAQHWIEHLGLSDFRAAMPETLSGGQKQRVALARALAHEPALLLLDEPLASLDAALKSQLRWEIRAALKAAGVPALWVTHDQTEALSVGDRMGVMQHGRLEQLDAPDHCFGRPKSRFVAHFLGEAMFVPGQLRADRVQTPLGEARIAPATEQSATAAVEVMLRPDDLALQCSNQGNSTIEYSHYEGETRLYTVSLLDSKLRLRVRTNHAQQIDDGAIVDTRICADHPLTLFAPQSA